MYSELSDIYLYGHCVNLNEVTSFRTRNWRKDIDNDRADRDPLLFTSACALNVERLSEVAERYVHRSTWVHWFFVWFFGWLDRWWRGAAGQAASQLPVW